MMAHLSSRCSGCNRTVLAVFIESFRSSTRCSPVSSVAPFQRRAFRRATHSAKPQTTFDVPSHVHSRSNPDQVTPVQQNGAAKKQSSMESNNLPWYLQVQSTQQPSIDSITERQKIPEIPSDAPTIMGSLLNHISDDLGLDYLSLLDLRKLDPPAAFGTNLFMIFGTARGEKHLNVSADRLCRWLRSNYKLRPYADGLVGRNELKLKLKRKAKRSRLMSSAGAIQSSDVDDGIRTGWICVNVGRVPGANVPEASKDEPLPPDFIGFGTKSAQAKIVVQMMTEQKRAEVDLESLWTATLARHERKARALAQLEEDVNLVDQDEEAHLFEEEISRNSNIPSGHLHFKPTQVLRTSCQRDVARLGKVSDHKQSSRKMESLIPGRQYLSTFPKLEDLHSRRPHKHDLMFEPNSNISSKRESKKTDHASSSKELQLLIRDLDNESDEVALQNLGDGEHDKSSTDFLRRFHNQIPLFPDDKQWACLIELHCRAVGLGHVGYSRAALLKNLHDAQQSGSRISENTYLLVLKTILCSPHRLNPIDMKQRPEHMGRYTQLAVRRSLNLAIDILEDLENAGCLAVTDDTLRMFYEAFTSPRFLTDTSSDYKHAGGCSPISTLSQHGIISNTGSTTYSGLRTSYQFHQVLTEVGWTPRSDDTSLAFLSGYAKQSDWWSFWAIWNFVARCMRRRSAALYELLFRELAKSGNSQACRKALRRIVPEMHREMPRVEIDHKIAEAIKSCLIVADASVDAEWTPVWKLIDPHLQLHEVFGDTGH